MNNQPKKHHFLPVFCLKQWAGSDGRVVQFSRPYRQIKPLKRHPEAIGFVTRLYTVEGLAPELANEMEREFLSPVDSRAADALRMMLYANIADRFSVAERLGWAKFVASLLVRMPDDIQKLRNVLSATNEQIVPFLDTFYQRVKPAEGPDSAEDVLAPTMQSFTSAQVMRAVKRVINDPRLINGIAGMEWRVRTLNDNTNELLTSDRPVAITNALNAPESHLVMPIGPRVVFLADRVPWRGVTEAWRPRISGLAGLVSVRVLPAG